MFKQIAYLFLFLFGTTVFSQVEEVQAPNYIKTITFKGNTPESQLPVLSLGDFVVMKKIIITVLSITITTGHLRF